jgi:hypothetical protein
MFTRRPRPALASALAIASLAASLAGLDDVSGELALASDWALLSGPRWTIAVHFALRCLFAVAAWVAWYEGAPIGFELLKYLVSAAIRLASAATPSKWHT